MSHYYLDKVYLVFAKKCCASFTHILNFTGSVNVLTMSYQTLYVGNLPHNITEREVEDLYEEYGRIVDIDVRSHPTGYCFVVFEYACDAQHAVHYRNGCNLYRN